MSAFLLLLFTTGSTLTLYVGIGGCDLSDQNCTQPTAAETAISLVRCVGSHCDVRHVAYTPGLPSWLELSHAGECLFAAQTNTNRILSFVADGGKLTLVSDVPSGGMYPVKLSLGALQGHVSRFEGVAAYAQTKRAEVILNALWAGRETGIAFHAMHPGWADTPGVQHSLPRFRSMTQGILRSPEQGADTLVWLAAAEGPGRASGQLWFDRAEVSPHAFPWTRESAADRASLWDLCERLTQTARAGPPA
jgi:NAD(P)-dependent dehydrogenase (short-subunit alcohol dehydrogenase family)